jgi:hypothetical protein
MRLYADIVQRMSGALRAATLYSISHPSVAEHVRALLDTVQRLHRTESSVLVGFIGGEVIADDTPLLAVTAYRTELIRYMQALGINRVLFERGVTLEELTEFVRAVSQPSPAALRGPHHEGPDDRRAHKRPNFRGEHYVSLREKNHREERGRHAGRDAVRHRRDEPPQQAL